MAVHDYIARPRMALSGEGRLYNAYALMPSTARTLTFMITKSSAARLRLFNWKKSTIFKVIFGSRARQFREEMYDTRN